MGPIWNSRQGLGSGLEKTVVLVRGYHGEVKVDSVVQVRKDSLE